MLSKIAGMLKSAYEFLVKKDIFASLIEEVPPDLEACESCRDLDCVRSKWEECPARLAAKGAIERSRGEDLSGVKAGDLLLVYFVSKSPEGKLFWSWGAATVEHPSDTGQIGMFKNVLCDQIGLFKVVLRDLPPSQQADLSFLLSDEGVTWYKLVSIPDPWVAPRENSLVFHVEHGKLIVRGVCDNDEAVDFAQKRYVRFVQEFDFRHLPPVAVEDIVIATVKVDGSSYYISKKGEGVLWYRILPPRRRSP